MAVPRAERPVTTAIRHAISFAGAVPEWADRAACVGVDPETFYPKSGSAGARRAKKVCARCEVRELCLAGALEFESGKQEGDGPVREPFGVFGGLAAKERKALMAQPRSERRSHIKAQAYADALAGFTARLLVEKYQINKDTAYRWIREAHAEQGGAS